MRKLYFDETTTPLKWFKFVKHFQLPMSILYNFIVLATILTGLMRAENYHFLDVISPVVYLTLAIVSVIGFGDFKAYGWYAFYGWMIIPVIYNGLLCVIGTTNGSDTNTAEIELASSLILFVLNGIYFWKRRFLFIKYKGYSSTGERETDQQGGEAMGMDFITKEIVCAATANKQQQPNHENDSDFGLVPEKPIYTLAQNLVDGQQDYLNSLCTENGEKILWKRRGSTSDPNVYGMIDIYDISLSSGTHYNTLYINMYGAAASSKAPAGFSFKKEVENVDVEEKDECLIEVIPQEKNENFSDAMYEVRLWNITQKGNFLLWASLCAVLSLALGLVHYWGEDIADIYSGAFYIVIDIISLIILPVLFILFILLDISKRIENKHPSFCKKCGWQVRRRNRFCNHCGGEVINTTRCRKCGSKIRHNSLFCQKCGEKNPTYKVTNNLEGLFYWNKGVKVFLFVILLVVFATEIGVMIFWENLVDKYDNSTNHFADTEMTSDDVYDLSEVDAGAEAYVLDNLYSKTVYGGTWIFDSLYMFENGRYARSISTRAGDFHNENDVFSVNDMGTYEQQSPYLYLKNSNGEIEKYLITEEYLIGCSSYLVGDVPRQNYFSATFTIDYADGSVEELIFYENGTVLLKTDDTVTFKGNYVREEYRISCINNTPNEPTLDFIIHNGKLNFDYYENYFWDAAWIQYKMLLYKKDVLKENLSVSERLDIVMYEREHPIESEQ